MNCQIVFYMAKKTGLCEKALSNSLKELGLKPQKTIFTTTPLQFGGALINAFKQCNLVFTVGGFYSTDKTGVEDILSNALSLHPPKDAKKIKNALSDDDGYVIRQGCQLITVLPDEPDEISELFNTPLKQYLKDFLKESN